MSDWLKAICFGLGVPLVAIALCVIGLSGLAIALLFFMGMVLLAVDL